MEPTVFDDSVVAEGARRRRIPGPDARAYTPSQTENTLLSMLNQQGAPQLLGFLMQARGDQQNAIAQQDEALRNQQQLQRASDTERAQLDLRRMDNSLLSALANNAPDAVLGSPILTRLIPQNVSAATVEGIRAHRAAQTARANRESGGGGAGGGNENIPLRDVRIINRDVEAATTRARSEAMRQYLQELGWRPEEIQQFGLTQQVPGSRRPLTPEQTAERDRRVATATEAARLRVLAPLPEAVRNRFNTPQAAAPVQQQPAAAPAGGEVAPPREAARPTTMTPEAARAAAQAAGGQLVRSPSTGQFGIRMPDGTVRPLQ